MSCLTTWTPDTQQDCIDIERLAAVITEIDDKLHDILERLDALESVGQTSK